MKPTQKRKAFTLIELLVVITIIAILAALATPALTNAIVQGQMTQTLNNARQLYLAGFQMALDGASTQDASLIWPGDGNGTTLQGYVVDKLVANDYLKSGDVVKLFSAPGASLGVTITGNATTLDAQKCALKVYQVKEKDDSRTVFAATQNLIYGTGLDAAKQPYTDKGFIVVRKGGDAYKLRKGQAVPGSDGNAYQSLVGKLPSAVDGTVASESSTDWLQ